MTLAPGASAGVRGYGYGTPMMCDFGTTSFHEALALFAMWFIWLIPLVVFSFIGFAVAWAAHQFTHKQN